MQRRPYRLHLQRHAAASPPESGRLSHLERLALPGQAAAGARIPSPPMEQDAPEFVLTELSYLLLGWFAELQFPHPIVEWKQVSALSLKLRERHQDWPRPP